MRDKEVVVSISLENETIRVGKLWFHVRGNRESVSFEYEKRWLMHPARFALEPALKLTEGSFHTKEHTSLFGSIGDSAPDRFGRILMRRFEVAKAKEESRPTLTLFEMDYLLGVNDVARQGALRFSVEPENDVFLAPKDENAIPPLLSLPRLLSATERLFDDKESADDLKLLLAPGSSLGGARPKASVRERDGSLMIAKFPKKDDEMNVVLWEAVALVLAKNAKIKVPAWRIEMIFKKPVLVLKRFDREGSWRIPFLSSMSMLDARDNEHHSYIEMAYALAQNGGSPEEDMAELWRRIIFTVMISNTDDHLRNHGFLYEKNKGWRLSPAYDMNPTPLHIKPHVLTTAIDFEDTSASLETALSVAQEFRLSKHDACTIIKEVSESVKQWRQVASDLGLSKRECEFMASAFENTSL